MSQSDFETMIDKGLPVYQLRDGSMRIIEPQVDRFFDAIQKKDGPGSAALSTEPFDGLSSILKEVRRSAKLLGSRSGDLALAERSQGREDPAIGLSDAGTIAAGRTVPTDGSTYLDAEDAAAYLRITMKSLYGVVERGHLLPFRGPRNRYRFTVAMLDEYLARRRNR